MRPPSLPYTQLAIDLPTIDEALRAAEIGIKAGFDILEAGTPLIVAEGVRAIAALGKEFPEYPILADYKTMDSGGKNVLLTAKNSGHYMTVCGNAADETVKAAVAAKPEAPSVQVVVDTIGVKDQPGRAKLCEQWGVDMIYIHYGADQHRSDASQDGTQWVEAVLDAVKIPVGVGTFGIDDAVRAVRTGASLVAMGHPLISGDDPLGALTRYIEAVKSAK